MGAHSVLLRRALVLVLVLVVGAAAACGGGSKKPPQQPAAKTETKPGPPAHETEADRETKRHAAALAIVPQGSKCLPAALKQDGAPQLQLAAVDKDVIVCAVDTDPSRLLGPVGCWKVDLTGALTYIDPMPVPGRGFDVKIDDHCARGFCMPDVAGSVAHIAWNLKSGKVAVMVGDDIHLFDGKTKAQLSAFSIRGDKGVTGDPVAVYYVGDAVFVEATDHTNRSVWQFKDDGTKAGPLVAIGSKDNKPLSNYKGGFSILDDNTVGLAERGYETLDTVEFATGKRAKLVRKIGKLACKPDEIEAFWHDGDKVTDKCKETLDKNYGYLIGATTFAGIKSFVVLLQGERLGELAVLDKRSLAENDKKVIKLPWCDQGGGAAAAQ